MSGTQLPGVPGTARVADRLAVQTVSGLSIAEQRANAGFHTQPQSVGVTRVRSDNHSNAALTSPTSPVLDAASANSGTTKPRTQLVMLECPPRGVEGGVVAPKPVLEQRLWSPSSESVVPRAST